jgi:acyl carrier protein
LGLTFDLAPTLRHNRGSRSPQTSNALIYKLAMPDTDLRKSIKEMLVKNLMLQATAEEIGDDLPLFGPGGLGLDSIDALELVVSMEKTFGVGVPNSEVAAKALRTVNTIHDYILEKRAAA